LFAPFSVAKIPACAKTISLTVAPGPVRDGSLYHTIKPPLPSGCKGTPFTLVGVSCEPVHERFVLKYMLVLNAIQSSLFIEIILYSIYQL